MDDLVAWLRAQVDEDERVAREAFTAVGGEWEVNGGYVEVVGDHRNRNVFDWTVCFDEGAPSGGQREHIALHDPARVLREVEAKRALIDDCESYHGEPFGQAGAAVTDGLSVRVLQFLALPYAGRPGYREEWKP